MSKLHLGRVALLLAISGAALAADWVLEPTSFTTTLGGDVTVDTDELTLTIPAGAVVPAADIYLLADTTGSMGGPLTDVKWHAEDIVDDLYGIAGVTVRIGVGNYKDFPSDTYAFDHQLAPAGVADTLLVQAAIESWYASGGWDGSEAQLFALDRLANDIDPAGGEIGWADDAEKIIVWFGDWPGHDAICAAISGLTYDITEATATADLVEGGFHVIAFSTTSGYGLDYDPNYSDYDYYTYCGDGTGTAGQGTRITTATGGAYLEDVESDELAAAIIDLVTDAVGEIDDVDIEASAELTGYVTDIEDTTPGLCVGIDTSEETTCTFDVTFEAECAEEAMVVTGTLTATADGAAVATQDVTLNIEDCCDVPVVETTALEMWPPNHKMQSFDLSDCATVLTEDCDGSPMDPDTSGTILSIRSDEPEDRFGGGDGKTLGDIVITGESSFALRAEREGFDDGRVYEVVFAVTNLHGDSVEASCFISVPHSNDGVPAVDDGDAGYEVLP